MSRNNKAIAEIYTKALFLAVKESNADVNQVQTFLDLFKDIGVKNNLTICIKDPNYNQQLFIDSLLKLINKNFSFVQDTLINLINVLHSNNRLETLPIIADKFERYVDLNNDILSVQFFTSVNSDLFDRNLVFQKLGRPEDKVNLEFAEDKQLIGGVKVKVGSNVYDYSNKSKINKLLNLLKNITY